MARLKPLSEYFTRTPEELILDRFNQRFGTHYTTDHVRFEVANEDESQSSILQVFPGLTPSSLPKLTNIRYQRMSLDSALSHAELTLRDMPLYASTHDLVTELNARLGTDFRPEDFVDTPLEKTNTPYPHRLELTSKHLLFVGGIDVTLVDPKLAHIVPAGLDSDVAIRVFLQGTDVELSRTSETKSEDGLQLSFENGVYVDVASDGLVTVTYDESPAVIVFEPTFTPSMDHGHAWGFAFDPDVVNYIHLLQAPDSTQPLVVMPNQAIELAAWPSLGVYVTEAFDPVRGDAGFVPGLAFSFRLLVAKPQVF